MNRENTLQRGDQRTAGGQEGRRVAARMGAVLALAIAAAGCGGEPGTAGITAQPRVSAQALNGAPQCTGTDVHQVHLSKFSCETCHPAGGVYAFSIPYVFPRGTSSAGGVLVLRTDTAPTTCTVACHYPMGGAPRSVTWNTPGPLACTECHAATSLPTTHPALPPTTTAAECQGCHQATTHLTGTVTLAGHDAGWTSPTSPAFHAFSAVRGLARCQGCHAQDLGGGAAGVSCGSCHDQHLPAGVTSWRTSCAMCHGGVNDLSGAPPAAIWGQAGDPARGAGTADPVRVGAHATHARGTLAPAFDCGVCHVKPADALAAGHIDEVPAGSTPLAGVTFGGLATQRLPSGTVPAWDRATATCTNTYCHGATVAGGTLKTPSWTTLDGSQAACGTCHGVPPPAPHPAVDVSAGSKACSPCHAGTIAPDGALIAPSARGQHLDGTVEATGHATGWMEPASAGFHAFSADASLAACTGCHGPNLDGVGGTATTACATCHDRNLPAGVASWRTSCTMCHGGGANPSGAPPKAIWGFAGDPLRGGGAADPIRVGAHSAHVTGASSSGVTLSAPFDCGACHVKPADALSTGHVDGTTATVTFSGLAAQGTTSSPTWTRATATCAGTYCHGATLPGGTNTSPTWTGGAAQIACGSCHGVPPPAATGHPQNTSCGNCHSGYTQTSVNAATHVNGALEVSGLTCSSCHGDALRPATALNPQLPAAPPTDTHGNVATTAPGVGAHQAHLQGGPLRGPLACTECHAIPASMVSHPSGALELAWGPLATTGGAAPAYAGGTCASTWCHGATPQAGGTNQAPRWTGGPAEAACGTCHGLPPGRLPSAAHPTYLYAAPCVGCHPATAEVDASGDAIVPGGGQHVNGAIEYTFAGHPPGWALPSWPGGDHARKTCMGCIANPGELTMGDYYVFCTECHGAAHDFNPTGGTSRVSCGACHPAFFDGNGVTSCSFCH